MFKKLIRTTDRHWPLLIAPVPLLHTAFHLCCIIRSQEQTLKATTGSHRSTGDEVIQGQPIEGPLRTTRTLCSLEDIFSHWVGPLRIIASTLGVLDIVGGFEPLKALHPGVINILGERDKSRRRRRNIESRHFEWRTGWWCKVQWLTLLLAAHVRHGLIWSSLPLPQDPSIYQPD